MAKNRKRHAKRTGKVINMNPFDGEYEDDELDSEKELCYHLYDMPYDEIKHIIDSIVISGKNNPHQISENIARYFYILGRLCAINVISSYKSDLFNEIASNPHIVNKRNIEVSQMKNMISEMQKYWEDGLQTGMYDNWAEIPNGVEKFVKERTGLDLQSDHVMNNYVESNVD